MFSWNNEQVMSRQEGLPLRLEISWLLQAELPVVGLLSGQTFGSINHRRSFAPRCLSNLLKIYLFWKSIYPITNSATCIVILINHILHSFFFFVYTLILDYYSKEFIPIFQHNRFRRRCLCSHSLMSGEGRAESKRPRVIGAPVRSVAACWPVCR